MENKYQIRKSQVSDKTAIGLLMERCFGACDYEDVFDDVEGRYLLFEYEGRIIAMTGLTSNTDYDGLEIDWTCTLPEYQCQGIMQELFSSLLLDVHKNIYCSAWQIPSMQKANLHDLLIKFGFHKVKDAVKMHFSNKEQRSSDCRNGCPYWNDVKCNCQENLYLRECFLNI